MGTDKRARQKAARQAKIEELQQRERRQAGKRRTFLIGGGIAAFIAVVIVFSVLTSDDDGGDQDVVSETPTSVDEGTDPGETPTTEAPEQPEGVEPVAFPDTVEVGDPAEPECPPAEGAERTLDFTGPFENCLEDGVDYVAVFDTNAGTVTVDLREDEMPNTVNNFVALTRYGYYDGTALFRTDPSIDIIQGGSPHTHSPSDPGPGYTITDEGGEFGTDDAGQYTGPFSYEAGQLVMARSAGPDSSGAQFFFTTGPNVSLLDSQGTYLLFGDVTEGLDVLQTIISLHEPGGQLGGAPRVPIVIDSVTIQEA